MKTLEFIPHSAAHLSRKAHFSRKKNQPSSIAGTNHFHSENEKVAKTTLTPTSINNLDVNPSQVFKMHLQLDEDSAGIEKLVLYLQKKELTLFNAETIKTFAGKSLSKRSGEVDPFFKPQFFNSNPQFFFGTPPTPLKASIQEISTFEKKAAASVRFFLNIDMPNSKQNRLKAEITYTFNWLQQLHISYKMHTLEDCPLMFCHPIYLNIPKNSIKDLELENANSSITLVQNYTTAKEGIQFSRNFNVKNSANEGSDRSVQRILTLPINDKNLCLHAFASATSLEYGTLNFTKKKNKPLFYINSFNGFTDTKAGKAVGTGSARSDFFFSNPSTVPFHPYGIFSPYVLKKGLPFHFQTVLQFSTQQAVL